MEFLMRPSAYGKDKQNSKRGPTARPRGNKLNAKAGSLCDWTAEGALGIFDIMAPQSCHTDFHYGSIEP